MVGILHCLRLLISFATLSRKVNSKGGFAQACSVGELFNMNSASGKSFPCSVQKKGQTVLVPSAKSSTVRLKYCPHDRMRSGGALHLSVCAMLVVTKHE